MKSVFSLLTALLLTNAVAITSVRAEEPATPPAETGAVQEKREEIKADRAQIREGRKALRQDRKELRQARREGRQERRATRRAKRGH